MDLPEVRAMPVQILESHTLTKFTKSPLARTFSVESKARAIIQLMLTVHDFTIEYELKDHNLMVLSYEQEAKYSLLMTVKALII
jgi:hypothetical protein